jgi:hypothetical protein
LWNDFDGKIMATISVKNEYLEVLDALGNLPEATDLALKQYAIDKIATKIAELRREDDRYQKKYGMNYSSFCQKISDSEEFIGQIENSIDKLWERDLAEWEFCHKGIEDWLEKLQTILLI